MTHFLRRNGKTIVDVEATVDDVHSIVCVEEYSRFLISEVARQEEVIRDFDALQELRGEWHEKVRQTGSPDEFVRGRLRKIAVKYELQYITD